MLTPLSFNMAAQQLCCAGEWPGDHTGGTRDPGSASWVLLSKISVASPFVFPLINALLGLLFAKSVCILRNYNTQVYKCQTENEKRRRIYHQVWYKKTDLLRWADHTASTMTSPSALIGLFNPVRTCFIHHNLSVSSRLFFLLWSSESSNNQLHPPRISSTVTAALHHRDASGFALANSLASSRSLLHPPFCSLTRDLQQKNYLTALLGLD